MDTTLHVPETRVLTTEPLGSLRHVHNYNAFSLWFYLFDEYSTSMVARRSRSYYQQNYKIYISVSIHSNLPQNVANEVVITYVTWVRWVLPSVSYYIWIFVQKVWEFTFLMCASLSASVTSACGLTLGIFTSCFDGFSNATSAYLQHRKEWFVATMQEQSMKQSVSYAGLVSWPLIDWTAKCHQWRSKCHKVIYPKCKCFFY